MRATFFAAVIAVLILITYSFFPDSSSAAIDPGGGGGGSTCGSLGGTCTSSGTCSGSDGTRVYPATPCSGTQICCRFPPTATPTITPTLRPSCISLGGRCLQPGTCQGEGGTTRSASGCPSGSICCVVPTRTPTPTSTPTPPPLVHECYDNPDCLAGEYCSRRVTGNVCMPLGSDSGDGSGNPGSSCVNECTRGCAPTESCYGYYDNSGCYNRYCLPSDDACIIERSGSCKASCRTGTYTDNGGNLVKEVVDAEVRCSTNNFVCCVPRSVCNTFSSSNDVGCSCHAQAGGVYGPTQCSLGLTCQHLSYCEFQEYFAYNNCTGKQGIYYSEFAGKDYFPDYMGTCVAGGGGGGPTRYDITGIVYQDDNLKKDSSDTFFAGATITISGPDPGSMVTDNRISQNFNYVFSGRRAGSYTITLTVPNGYRKTTSTVRTVNLSNYSLANINFGIASTYTVSGSVFEDTNGNGRKDVGEINYTKGSIAVTSNSGTVTKPPGTGEYNVSDILSGTYIVSFIPPGSYYTSVPKPPQFQVTVGTSCSISNTSTGGLCLGGNIEKLDFPVKTSGAWMQTYGFDVRLDDGYTNNIPANPDYPAYASVEDAP